MTSDEIRAAFLSFFEGKGHKIIPSSSLIPHGDPTLLLTSAGMVQFKPYFLGEAVPPSTRLASCQKCFRTTDIESVGDPSHLTFFEMLGNFSVGDYFKQEAISWAWEFVSQRLALPPERLWITIFLDDDESFHIWQKLGVAEQRIIRFGEEDNFWGPAGDSGPCGPCSEIIYDFGEEFGCGKVSCAPGCECGRFSEIWNLVFTQYNQDREGHRTLLPKPNIDTGMGLERTAAVMQGKTSVYAADLFAPLLECISGLAGKKYGSDNDADNAMRIIAEHSRGIAFLIADGVIPSNEGRGYVLRRLLRRAALFGRRLGMDKPFLAETAKTTIEQMGHIYPEVVQRQDFILKVIELEEARFGETLNTGLELLDRRILQALQQYTNLARQTGEAVLKFQKVLVRPEVLQAIQQYANVAQRIGETVLKFQKALARPEVLQTVQQLGERYQGMAEVLQRFQPSSEILMAVQQWGEQYRELIKIPGGDVFKLYDTYGFPVELTREIAAENGFSIDSEGFEKEMEKQRERARAAHKFELEKDAVLTEKGLFELKFVGYKKLECKARIWRLLVGGKPVREAKQGQEVNLSLDVTPFYAEMGGQVGDTGEIRGHHGTIKVKDAIGHNMHQGKVISGTISDGERVVATVDRERRLDIARNHTATHLLQFALRRVLGEHVQQRGSLVAPDRFRFDFSHLVAMTQEEIWEVEHIVNERVRQNLTVYDEEIPYKEAIEEGAIALFDEKYGDVVRVIKIGKPAISSELCGGTHLASTGEIGFFHIIGESSIGAGLRRIEAITGRGAEAFIDQRLSDLQKTAESLDAKLDNVLDKAYSLITELDKERKRALALERELSKKIAESLLSQAEVVSGVTVLTARVPSLRLEALREMSDLLRDKLKSVVIVLGTVYEDKPIFLAVVTPDLVSRGYNAGEIIKQVAKVTGGGGGGKATFAQAGGKYKNKLDEALQLVRSLI